MKAAIRQIQRGLFALAAAALLAAACFAQTEKQPESPKIPAVGDTAPDFELKALNGKDVKLSKFVSKKPGILVVLRGFPGYQCPLCTRQVGDFLTHADEIKASGARVLMVYPGPAEDLEKRASEFLKNKTLPEHFTLVTDPDFKFTKQYALRWDAPNETAYPSTFVLTTQRKIVYEKVSKSHGNRSAPEDVIAAVKGIDKH